MSNKLTEEIIKRVYKCIGVILPGDTATIESIMQNTFIIPNKIIFDDGANGGSIWAIQSNINEQNSIKLMLADCSQSEVPEYALLIAIDGAPSYATYLGYREYADINSPYNYDALIACSVQDGSWVECSVYLQATFLCGMEKLRELSAGFEPLRDPDKMLYDLLKFIKYYEERENARKEDR